MNIELNIERLILDGFTLSRKEGALVQQAVEAELTQLLADAGLARALKTDASLAYLPVRTIQPMSGINPTKMGQQIARAVYGGIGK